MKNEKSLTRWMWLFVALLSGAFILFLALLPNKEYGYAAINLKPLVHPAQAIQCVLTHCPNFQNSLSLVIINIIGNIVAFIPIGYGFTAFTKTFLKKRYATVIAITAGFGLSLSIELLQLNVIGRISDIDDLIFNTLGTLIGVSLYFGRLFLKRKDSSIGK